MKKIRQMFVRSMIHATIPFYRLYCFVVRPNTFGAKCIIEHNGRLLMIRNTYGGGRWTFPGGGIKKGETAEEAARREVREEVGIAELSDVRLMGVHHYNGEYKHDAIYCFCARTASDYFSIDPIEIAEAEWFSLANLPKSRGNFAEVMLAMYRKLPH